MKQDQYFSELRQRLIFHGASWRRAAEILAEARSHLADSGEDPVDAFGTPEEYAASVLRGHRWPTARALALLLLGVVGGSLATISFFALYSGEQAVSLGASEVVTWTGIVVFLPLAMSPMVYRRFPERAGRGVVGALIAAPFVGTFLGVRLLGDRTLVSMGSWTGLLTGLGLLAAAVLLTRHR